MSLDRLRITEAPAALVDFARKHNALVDLLASATGANGLKVTVTEKNLVISIQGPLTVSGLTVKGSATVTGSVTANSASITTTITADNATVASDFTLHETLMTTATFDVCDEGETTSRTFVVDFTG